MLNILKRENHTQKRAALLYPNNNIPDENLRGIFLNDYTPVVSLSTAVSRCSV